ncbi:MAG TPA: endonuclease domain-containing protein [Streptomyces sp.]|nr:endonuclease domain-containing protein [Streptomyces sp.]
MTVGHAASSGRPCSHSRYGLTCCAYDQLVREAGGRCQICGRAGQATGRGYLVVDHDPKIGDWAVRGLLCSTCNLTIEYADAPTSTQAAYLASPWHARRGLTVPDEPPVGSRVQTGRRTYLRTSSAWEACDEFRGRRTMSWSQLTRRHPPDSLTIYSSVQAPAVAH